MIRQLKTHDLQQKIEVGWFCRKNTVGDLITVFKYENRPKTNGFKL